MSRTPEQERRKHFRRRGIDPDLADEALADHDGACAICQTVEPGPKGWIVDYNHQDGRIQGILCRRCASVIAFTHRDPLVLEAAANYVEP